MLAHESEIRSRLWFSINLLAAAAILVCLGLQHASAWTYGEQPVLVLGGLLFLSVSAEAIYSGNIAIQLGFALSREKTPYKFWLITLLLAAAGVRMLLSAF